MSQPALSKKIQFLNAQHPRPLLLQDDLLVQLFPANDNGREKLEMYIKVPEGVTALGIKKSASAIAGWRHALTEFQGHSETSGYDALYTAIKKRREAGDSLDDIATMLNREIENSIVHARNLFNQKEAWWFLSLRAARDILIGMGCSTKKADEFLKSAIDDLETGRPIFGGTQKKKSGKPTYLKNQAPITTTHVQRVLKRL